MSWNPTDLVMLALMAICTVTPTVQRLYHRHRLLAKEVS